jgi:ABC-type multidrug transport system ATPase subunit
MTLLSAHGLWKSLGGRIVLRGVKLEIADGERVVLRGANGSGKSTLLQLLSGVLALDSGTVETRGGATIAFAPERPDLPEHLLVGEWLDLVASLKGLRRSDVDAFGVRELRGKAVRALSLGQKQRVSLAAAWLGTPSLLVLDEPTNALDLETRAELITRLRSASAAILATHDDELAVAIGTRTVAMQAGLVG